VINQLLGSAISSFCTCLYTDIPYTTSPTSNRNTITTDNLLSSGIY
jgi:hypothetical protein